MRRTHAELDSRVCVEHRRLPTPISICRRRNGWPISQLVLGRGGQPRDWSEQLFEIYGRTPEEFGGTFDEFLGFIRPTTGRGVEQAWRAALKDQRAFSHEEHIVRPDGGIRHLQRAGESCVTSTRTCAWRAAWT